MPCPWHIRSLLLLLLSPTSHQPSCLLMNADSICCLATWGKGDRQGKLLHLCFKWKSASESCYKMLPYMLPCPPSRTQCFILPPSPMKCSLRMLSSCLATSLYVLPHKTIVNPQKVYPFMEPWRYQAPYMLNISPMLGERNQSCVLYTKCNHD